MLTPDQARIAMAMLEITREELAEVAEVHRETISSFLHNKRPISSWTLAKIESYFEEKGVVFLKPGDPSLDGGIGVRMRAPPPRKVSRSRRAMAN